MNRAMEPDISLIVPVLNEEMSLPAFLESIKKQRDIPFEVVFCDGGSTDQTINLLRSYKSELMLRVVSGEKGRGRQMNRGVRHARTPNLLFLHADSIFPESNALRKAADAFEFEIKKNNCEKIAGHFSLHFLRRNFQPSLAFYYYECKTCLNRPGCINGDQGILIRRSFFLELGGFDESLGFLEDELLARTIFEQGRWLLLPGLIQTSARRFEKEGLYERQVLNALIMNFSNIGWNAYFHKAAGIYQEQNDAPRLNLRPFFQTIVALLEKETFKKRCSLWYRTGAYVNNNAWQIAFFLDARAAFKKASRQRDLATPNLKFFETFLRPCINHPPGFAVAGFLTWLWFYSYRIWMWFKAS
ncbi:MAG: TIGR04283 family arsenosugar biosynthesis glycosyltransferase [Deltaproteobacteria bacterium]|nr:TIGR04283 family arsenosugar biosynthesis glycosyltransferase [Deltaproteobacteria bacterium]